MASDPFHLSKDYPSVQITANTVEDQPAKVSWHGQAHNYNLSQVLEFRDNLPEAIGTHSSKQAYWETLSAEVTSKVHEFEEIGYAKWFAHARRYARLVMHVLQVKETLESLKDWVILLFGEDISNDEREGYVQTAYRGWLVERFGTATKADAYVSSEEYKAHELEGFRQGMLQYLAAGWTFEKVTKTLRSLKEEAIKVQAFAKTMDSRSYKMKEYKDIEAAKYGNIGPINIDAIADEVRKRLLSKVPSSPVNGIIDKQVDEASLMATVSKSKHSQRK